MVMAIDVLKRLDRHSQISGRFPKACTGLHKPRRSHMAQRMWRDLAIQARLGNGAVKCDLDGLTGLPMLRPVLQPDREAVGWWYREAVGWW
jgi:hypothetical protein